MAFRLFSRIRRKGAPIEASIEVERYGDGTRRYRAVPMRMAIRGKAISFPGEDFISYGWSARAARRRCLKKVLAYLRDQAKLREDL